MISLLRNKRPLYVCRVHLENHTKIYDAPILLYENYQIPNTEADLQSFGMESYQYIRIKTNVSNKDHYHLGDRAYIGIEPPQEHDTLCKTANYEVYKEPVPSLNELEVVFRRLSGK